MELNYLIQQTQMELWDLMFTRYLSQELLSWQWWVILAYLIVMYAIWVKIVDTARLREIMLLGSFIAVAAAMIDVVGVSRGFWQYDIRLLPISAEIFPSDYTAFPICTMIVYQYTHNWRSYISWLTLVSAGFCFLIIPFFNLIGVVKLLDWNFAYTFIIYIIVAAFARFVIIYINNLEAASKQQPSPVQASFSVVPGPALKPANSADEENE